MNKNLVLSDFNNVPGELIDNKWKFPEVKTINNKTKKEKVWNIFIEANLPLNPQWVTGQETPPDNMEVKIYSIYGYVGSIMTRSADKVIKAGKVKRNIVQQALSEANDSWRKQCNKSAAERKQLRPQLLKEYNEETIASVRKKFKSGSDLYISYKLDGVRCCAIMDEGEVILYSRELHGYDIPHIKEALKDFFNDYPTLMLDGELYLHNTTQSIISGAVRSGEKTKLTAEQKYIRDNLSYHIFDIINPDDLSIKFQDRYDFLVSMFGNVIKKNPCYLIEQVKVEFNEFVAKNKGRELMEFANSIGMEGLVIRLANGDYQESINGYHSINALKLKPVLDAEFPIIGFTDGDGKNKGAIQWELMVPDVNLSFSVVPAQPYEERQRLFKLFTDSPDVFEKEYKGRMMNVEFASWTKNGLPWQPRAKEIRDFM